MESLAAKKRTLMMRKYGLFKSKVYLTLQLVLFCKQLDTIVTENYNGIGKKNKIKTAKMLFEYVYTTRDIWAFIPKFVAVIKNKLFDFSPKYEQFKKYLYLLGFICDWPLGNESLCDKKTESDLCEEHIKEKNKLSRTITKSIICLPESICSIISEYARPKKYETKFQSKKIK